MKKHMVTFVLTASFGTMVMAQGSAVQPAVGVIASVDGLVTVSQGNTLGNVVKDEPILQGARVATTSTGSATITLNNGCIINLVPNQVVTIDSRLDCPAQVAGILPVGAVAGAGGAGAVSPIVGDALIPALIVGGALINVLTNTADSPLQSLSGS